MLLVFYLAVVLSVPSVLCGSCKNPEVTVTSYATSDATVVTNIAFIAEFSLKCPNDEQLTTIYADINGNFSPVLNIPEFKHQISWIEEIKSSTAGDRIVKLYDEEGYAAVRKAIRAGDDVESVPPLTTITVPYSGAFKGPWLKSEFMAAALAFAVAYIAFSSRAKLLS